MKLYEVPAGSKEWLDIRKTYITATEVPVLFGLNPYTSPMKMLANKDNKVFTGNIYTRRGNILEPAVFMLCGIEYGHKVRRWAPEDMEYVYSLPEVGISCTPDGRYKDKAGDVPVECKTVIHSSYLKKWLPEGHPPAHYLMQTYVQMYILDAPYGLLIGMAVSDALESMLVRIARVPRLEVLIKEQVDKFKEHTAEGKKFRVSSPVKKEAIELLKQAIDVTYCEYSEELLARSVASENIDWGEF